MAVSEGTYLPHHPQFPPTNSFHPDTIFFLRRTPPLCPIATGNAPRRTHVPDILVNNSLTCRSLPKVPHPSPLTTGTPRACFTLNSPLRNGRPDSKNTFFFFFFFFMCDFFFFKKKKRHSDAAPLVFLVGNERPPNLATLPEGKHIETSKRRPRSGGGGGSEGVGVRGGRGVGRLGGLGDGVGWLGWLLGVGLVICVGVVRTWDDIARRRPTIKKKGAESWVLILVLPRHFGRVVKASAC